MLFDGIIDDLVSAVGGGGRAWRNITITSERIGAGFRTDGCQLACNHERIDASEMNDKVLDDSAKWQDSPASAVTHGAVVVCLVGSGRPLMWPGAAVATRRLPESRRVRRRSQ